MAQVLVHSPTPYAPLLAGFLTQVCGAEILACCRDVGATTAAIDATVPDLLLLESDGAAPCHEPGQICSCVVVIRHLLHRHGEARVILLESAAGHAALPAALQTAVLTRLPGAMHWSELLQGLRGSLSGMAPPVMPDPARFQSLRPRERVLLDQIGLGLSSKEIARSLGLTLRTVETYRKTISARLGVSGAQLVRVAVLQTCAAAAPEASRPLPMAAADGRRG
ncbi:MAG: LuxR C-terminal-related transcriptional regulator [Cyanobium sp.]